MQSVEIERREGRVVDWGQNWGSHLQKLQIFYGAQKGWQLVAGLIHCVDNECSVFERPRPGGAYHDHLLAPAR